MSDYLEHVVGPSTRFDHLAYRYYGDANRTAPIIEANLAFWVDDLSSIPTVLPVGLVLKIPIVEEVTPATDLLPPWKR